MTKLLNGFFAAMLILPLAAMHNSNSSAIAAENSADGGITNSAVDSLLESCEKRLLKSDVLVEADRKLLCKRESETLARVQDFNKNVLNSPAVAALNATSEKSVAVNSPDEFAVNLLNGFDQNGNFQKGIALDASPFKLFFGGKTTLADYRSSRAIRFLSNTQFSIATVAGDDAEDKSSKLALGLQFSPLDLFTLNQSDPKMNDKFLGCSRKTLKSIWKNTPRASEIARNKITDQDLRRKIMSSKPGDPNYPKKQEIENEWKKILFANLDAEFSGKEFQNCKEELDSELENANGWTAGLAPVWLSKEGDLDDLEFTGMTAWTSLAINLPFSDSKFFDSDGRITLHANYQFDELSPIAGAENQFEEQDKLVLAALLNLEGPDSLAGDIFQKFKFTFETLYLDADKETQPDDSYFQVSAKAQFKMPKIGENIWLNLSYGKTIGRFGEEASFVRTGLNWAFNDTTPAAK